MTEPQPPKQDFLSSANPRPFANGTELSEWESKWCDYCIHDHGSHANDIAPLCDLMLFAMMPDELPWPEAWVAAPDYGFHLPARIACLRFEPCHEGDCTGDEGAAARPAYVASILDDFKAAHRG